MAESCYEIMPGNGDFRFSAQLVNDRRGHQAINGANDDAYLLSETMNNGTATGRSEGVS